MGHWSSDSDSIQLTYCQICYDVIVTHYRNLTFQKSRNKKRVRSECPVIFTMAAETAYWRTRAFENSHYTINVKYSSIELQSLRFYETHVIRELNLLEE